MGTPESIPGEAECQQAMAAAKALCYGHGRFLSYVSPSAVASVDLSSCRLAVLACNTNNEESQRMQAMLDGRKTADKKALKNPQDGRAVVHGGRIYCAAKFHCRECKSQLDSNLCVGRRSRGELCLEG